MNLTLTRLLALIPALVLACAAARAAEPAPQQPFVCRTYESGFGQPLVDNHDGIGHPVFDPITGEPVGFSKNCNVETRIQFFYYTGSAFKPFDPAAKTPADLKTVKRHGVELPFIVRVEGGTINRFMYTIAMLVPLPLPAQASGVDGAEWNRKLVYWLRGGVGIGHHQGLAMWFNDGLSKSERALLPRILAQGYAVASSSGNETGVHYNMRLAEDTAAKVKARFEAGYGKPLYTIGVGGSGGAVQQYLFAQNRPGLIDGGVPVQSYPDMVTQTIPISDCPLLGQYFKEEVARDPASMWATWSRQSLIEGMNASDTAKNAIYGNQGSTECINGWRLAMPNVMNPVYKDPRFDRAATVYRYPANVFANVKWTHWNDLAEIYGTDSAGFANVTVDNVGVQYGLSALTNGQISADEFLRINACVGGWKAQRDFVQWQQADDPNDAQNMMRSATCRDPAGTPAPRHAADSTAIASAFSGAQVFTGARLGIPMVDLRPYLEPELNMHNARQSFSVRARLADGNPGDTRKQVIWFAQSEAKLADQVLEALALVDRYLETGSAPAGFVDKCMDAEGALIAAGPQVWDGVLTKAAPGACTRAFPIYSSPRMVAGETIKGDVFKCALKPVATALQDGTYGASAFSAAQRDWLVRIFPAGVCDYRKGEAGRVLKR